ncbi:hypothetical protein EGR_09795 [Echinococcus granulosus]|uniref:Uncharacterized protein n=1 Tax=Echinococcus granulosus TaxID=6210 RepID=W6U2Q5_ECHGR|nr:hypothetical protein EGR_09795 [Echinococcus granulosus]EUB55358.1 hypothetical protein EGR_09795 [Echinococcus granulosus]
MKMFAHFRDKMEKKMYRFAKGGLGIQSSGSEVEVHRLAFRLISDSRTHKHAIVLKKFKKNEKVRVDLHAVKQNWMISGGCHRMTFETTPPNHNYKKRSRLIPHGGLSFGRSTWQLKREETEQIRMIPLQSGNNYKPSTTYLFPKEFYYANSQDVMALGNFLSASGVVRDAQRCWRTATGWASLQKVAEKLKMVKKDRLKSLYLERNKIFESLFSDYVMQIAKLKRFTNDKRIMCFSDQNTVAVCILF